MKCTAQMRAVAEKNGKFWTPIWISSLHRILHAHNEQAKINASSTGKTCGATRTYSALIAAVAVVVLVKKDENPTGIRVSPEQDTVLYEPR